MRLIKLSVLFTSMSFAALYPVVAQNGPPAKAAAQQPAQITVGTNLVLVPVVVTDKKGDHVTGLTKDDFEIKEEGTSESIVRFDEMTADLGKIQTANAAPNTFSNELMAEHPKKLEIIALDRINTPFASVADANRGVIQFLSKNVDANTLLAMIVFQPNGIRVIHNFTSQPATLVAAVQKVQAALSSRDVRSQDIPGDTAEADAEALQIQNLFSAIPTQGAGGAAELGAARARVAQARAQSDASQQSQGGLVTLECLQQAAQYFSGVPGRKSLIWASTAFPFSLGSTAQELTRGTTYGDWQRTVKMLQDANVSVYPVDVSGLLPSGGANNIQSINSNAIRTQGAEGGVSGRGAQMDAVTNGSFVDPTAGRHETMKQLAEMTGGEAFYNSNDGATLFRRAGDDASQYYVLAFYTKAGGKQGWRKLNVKVHRDGTKVRARSGYFFYQSGNVPDGAKVAEEMMALDSDLSFTGIPIRGIWGQIETEGNERKVHFQLSIPAGVPAIDTENQNRISLDFRILAKNSSDQTTATIGQRLETKLDDSGIAQIRAKGLDYQNTLTLPPGQYKIHFVVRDNLRGVTGSIMAPLTVQ